GASATAYTVHYSYAGSSEFLQASGSSPLTVQKATPMITWADPADITYGTALGATQLNATSSWAVGGVLGSIAGTFTFTLVNGTLTVNQAHLTVTADAQSKVYGDADPALTYHITSGSLVNGDAFAGALSRDAGEDVGSYAITQGTLALSGNYDLSYVGA